VYRVAVSGDDRRAVVRFDQDLPPGEEVDLLVDDLTAPGSASHEWLRVFVYTKEGESKVSWVRLLPRRPGRAAPGAGKSASEPAAATGRR
jgi:hypothetical protein